MLRETAPGAKSQLKMQTLGLAAPSHGIQSRDSPCDVPEFLPVAAGRALQAAARISGHLWLCGD